MLDCVQEFRLLDRLVPRLLLALLENPRSRVCRSLRNAVFARTGPHAPSARTARVDGGGAGKACYRPIGAIHHDRVRERVLILPLFAVLAHYYRGEPVPCACDSDAVSGTAVLPPNDGIARPWSGRGRWTNIILTRVRFLKPNFGG